MTLVVLFLENAVSHLMLKIGQSPMHKSVWNCVSSLTVASTSPTMALMTTAWVSQLVWNSVWALVKNATLAIPHVLVTATQSEPNK